MWEELPLLSPDHKSVTPRMVTLNISGGRKDKLRAGDILGALTGDAGLDGKQIGKMTILQLRPMWQWNTALLLWRWSDFRQERSREGHSG